MQLNKKLLTLLAIATLGFTAANAETTMCFKENHKNFATIEQAKLQGGLCAGTKNVEEMKKDGWTVDDIKISGNNYIYVFKKQTTLTTVNMAELERKIIERLELKKQQERELAKIEMRKYKTASGERTYIKKCANCHGEKGDRAFGTSRAISQLNLDDFLMTIRDYGLGTYDRGQAFLMAPYSIPSKDAENVYVYLQSLKPKKEAKKEEVK